MVLDFGQSQIDQYWFSAWAIGSNPSDIDVFVAFEDAAELEIPELVLHHQNLANYSFDNDGGGFYVIDNASAIAVIFGGTVFDPGWQLGH